MQRHHFGLIYLKKLFSEGIADKKGEVISNKVIRSVIEDAIGREDKKHPYTDQQLVNILSSGGYNIARRTIGQISRTIADTYSTDTGSMGVADFCADKKSFFITFKVVI